MHLTVLEERSESFRLRFATDPGERWDTALAAWKRQVPKDLRRFEEDASVWVVPKSPDTESLLGEVFPDFASQLGHIRNQLHLF